MPFWSFFHTFDGLFGLDAPVFIEIGLHHRNSSMSYFQFSDPKSSPNFEFYLSSTASKSDWSWMNLEYFESSFPSRLFRRCLNNHLYTLQMNPCCSHLNLCFLIRGFATKLHYGHLLRFLINWSFWVRIRQFGCLLYFSFKLKYSVSLIFYLSHFANSLCTQCNLSRPCSFHRWAFPRLLFGDISSICTYFASKFSYRCRLLLIWPFGDHAWNTCHIALYSSFGFVSK